MLDKDDAISDGGEVAKDPKRGQGENTFPIETFPIGKRGACGVLGSISCMENGRIHFSRWKKPRAQGVSFLQTY